MGTPCPTAKPTAASASKTTYLRSPTPEPFIITTPVGACMNEMDQDVWTGSGKGSFGSDLRRCGMQCLANGGPCVSTCFQKDPGYSVDCSDCIGEMAECTKNNCLGDCISGNDAKCSQCVNAKCKPAFTQCSGLSGDDDSPRASPPAPTSKPVIIT